MSYGYKDIKYLASVWDRSLSLSLSFSSPGALFNCLADSWIDRQAGWKADGQTGRQTDRQIVSQSALNETSEGWLTHWNWSWSWSWNRNCLGRVRWLCLSFVHFMQINDKFPSPPPPSRTPSPLVPISCQRRRFVPFHYKHLKTFILFEDFHFQSVEMSHSRMGTPRLESTHCSLSYPCSLPAPLPVGFLWSIQ